MPRQGKGIERTPEAERAARELPRKGTTDALSFMREARSRVRGSRAEDAAGRTGGASEATERCHTTLEERVREPIRHRTPPARGTPVIDFQSDSKAPRSRVSTSAGRGAFAKSKEGATPAGVARNPTFTQGFVIPVLRR